MGAERAEARRVRRIGAGDWQELRTLRLTALRSDPLAFGSTLEREEGFPDDLWRERTERGATSDSTAQWVAEGPDGGFLGTAVIAEVDAQVHLFAMWVEPKLRGQGIGGLLLDAALSWAAKAFPGRSVHLEVNRGQAAAVRLYESRGFGFTGRSRPIGHTEGVEVHEMVRPPRAGGEPPAGPGTPPATKP